MQLPLFPTRSDWRPLPVSALPSWAGAKRIGFDIETKDPDIKALGPSGCRRPGTFIAGFSFAIEDGPGYYLPINHAGGDNLPADQVLAYIREQAAAFTGEIVGANLQYEIDNCNTYGIKFPNVRFFRDVQIADPLIYELHDRYSLEAIAQRWGFEGKRENMLREAADNHGINPKRDMWQLAARYVGEYAIEDARLPLAILRKQERQIEDDDLWKVYDLESRLLPILAQLRMHGVHVHLGRLERIEQWARAQEAEALAKIHHATGVRIGSVMSADECYPALAAIGARVGKTEKGQWKLTAEFLASLKHPVADAIIRARKTNKLRTTFVQSVRDHMTPDGRVHPTYNQMRKSKDEADAATDAEASEGAKYGRLSCVHPNLQQQPSRDDFAPMWRAIYLPEDGDQWAACDYSQQEPRMAVHYGCLARHLIGNDAWASAITMRDKYRNDPKADNHQMMADLANIKRKEAKALFLGLSYGMGGAKMCRSLNLPTRWLVRGKFGRTFDVTSEEGKALIAEGARRWEGAGVEGQAILDKFDAAVPFVKRLAMECEKRAKAVGYITTIVGQRCHFPRDPAGNYDWTHKAFNRLIQGSSAYQMKLAMVAMHAAGVRMLIQVHDEVGVSVCDEEEAKRAAQVMLDCLPLEVPSKVDIEIGESWGGSMGWREVA